MFKIISINPSVVVEYGSIVVEVEETVDYQLLAGCSLGFNIEMTPSNPAYNIDILGVRTLCEPTFAGYVDAPSEFSEVGLYRLGDKAIRLKSGDRIVYKLEIKVTSMSGSGFLTLKRYTSRIADNVIMKCDIAGYSSTINGYIKYYVSRNGSYNKFPSRPVILNIQKDSMKVEEENIITGTGFGTVTGNVIIGTKTLLSSSILSWADSQIKIRPVKQDTATGIIKVYRPDIDQVSDSRFTLTVNAKPAPMITKTNFTGNSTRMGIVQKLVVTGSGFGELEGNIYIGSESLELLSWSDTRIEAVIAASTVSGTLSVTSNYGDISNGMVFTLTEAVPIIDNMLPEICEVNDQISITGKNFGSSIGTVVVGDLGFALDTISWSDTCIIARVPSGTISGNVSVVTGSKSKSNAKALSVITSTTTNTVPIINRMTPPGGPPGTQVTITGTNFGQFKAGVCYVSVGTLNMEVSASNWSNTSIVCKLPLNAKTSYVKINTQYGISNEALFIVADEPLPSDVIIHPKATPNTSSPVITHTSPAYSGHGGNRLTIFGDNFGRSQGKVKFGETELSIVTNTWTKNSVQVCLPDLWTNVALEDRPSNMSIRDLLCVSNEIGYSNKVSFALLSPAPKITSISPSSPKVGDKITVNGVYFGSGIDADNSYIRFGSTSDRIISRGRLDFWSDTKIEFIAPDDVDYSMNLISVVADKIKSDWYSLSIAYIDPEDTDPVSVGDIKNELGQIKASKRRSVPPIVNVPTGAPIVTNLDADKFNGRHWEDIVELVENYYSSAPKLAEKLSTINGVSPDVANNIKLCGSGNVEIVPNPDSNEIIISGLPLDSGTTDITSNVIVNYGGIVSIKGEDGVIVTNNNGTVTISLDIGDGVNQVSPGDHTHTGGSNYVVYA